MNPFRSTASSVDSIARRRRALCLPRLGLMRCSVTPGLQIASEPHECDSVRRWRCWATRNASASSPGSPRRGRLYPSDADCAAPIVGSDPGGQTRRAAVGQRSETGRIGGVECPVNRWIVSLVLTTLTGTALASAPMQKTQSPGFYRTMLGEFEVTVLSDGVLPFKVQGLLTNITPAQLDSDLALAFLKEPVELSVNGFLINTGAKLELIDTGTGGAFGPSVGKLLANLTAAGYRPEQVDDIYITHMHGDHIGGLMKD